MVIYNIRRMIEKDIPDICVDEIMEKIMAEIKRRKPSQVGETKSVNAASLPQPKPFELKEEGYHIDDFLKYNGREFVINAYRGILGRESDPKGFDNYLENLSLGKMTKTEILESLRYSPEGRAKGITIRGLFSPFFVHSFCRIPVFGFFMQLIVYIFQFPKTIRDFSFRFEKLINEKVNFQTLEASIANLVNRQEFEQLSERKVDRSEFESMAEQRVESDKRISVLQHGTDQIHTKVRDILRQVHDHKLNILDQDRRLKLLLEEARKRLPEPFSVKQIEDMIKEEDHLLDAMYVAFEDQFRGTRQDIKERVGVYLPYIQKVKSSVEDFLLIDTGCGRGEWLELLKEQGIKGQGIDQNRIMIKQCEEYGIDVIEGDAIESLRNFPTASLGAVTAFHLIEHLPLDVLINFIDETVRVLRPGGIAIFETPNPENIIVGTFSFYLDPTHRRPLPGPMMKFLAEARGLYDVEIKYLHPYGEEFKLKDDKSEIAVRFERYFYGPQDYAIIGYKA